MNLMYSLSVCGLMVRLSFGCDVEHDGDLGMEINDDFIYANSDSKIFANVYSNGEWAGWRRIYHASCDNFEKGQVDWFNDFQSITTEWEGVSFYNCGTEGVLIESVWYWDGSKNTKIRYWHNSVFGPFSQACLYNDAAQANVDSPNVWYSDIFVDGDSSWGGFCKGVTFETSSDYGKVWTGTHPGRPNCAASENGQAPIIPSHKYAPYINTDTQFEETLMDYLMIVIGIAVLLFVSNSCLITTMFKKSLSSNPNYEYGKVYKTDME